MQSCTALKHIKKQSHPLIKWKIPSSEGKQIVILAKTPMLNDYGMSHNITVFEC